MVEIPIDYRENVTLLAAPCRLRQGRGRSESRWQRRPSRCRKLLRGRRVVRDGRDAGRDLAVRRQPGGAGGLRRRGRRPPGDRRGGGGDAKPGAGARARGRPRPARRLSCATAARSSRETIAREAGKPIATAQVEADRAVQTILFSAVEARALGGEVIGMDAHPAGDGQAGLVMRLPIGIVGAISPFNFPLNLVAHKVAPAFAAGCAVVLKPAGVDAALGAAAGAGLRGRGPAGRVAERRRRPLERDRRRDGRPIAGQADHVHRLIRRGLEAARARVAQEGVARARQLDADDRAGRRRHGEGGDRRRRQRLLLLRPELHLGAARVRAGRGLRRLRRPRCGRRSRRS